MSMISPIEWDDDSRVCLWSVECPCGKIFSVEASATQIQFAKCPRCRTSQMIDNDNQEGDDE
jgi:hypothetical protein